MLKLHPFEGIPLECRKYAVKMTGRSWDDISKMRPKNPNLEDLRIKFFVDNAKDVLDCRSKNGSKYFPEKKRDEFVKKTGKSW